MQHTVTIEDILQVLGVAFLAGAVVWFGIKYGLKD